MLKAASVDVNKLWKAAGKPRHGSVYNARQSSRKRYRARLNNNNNNNNKHDNVYGAVIMAEPLREFTRFI